MQYIVSTDRDAVARYIDGTSLPTDVVGVGDNDRVALQAALGRDTLAGVGGIWPCFENALTYLQHAPGETIAHSQVFVTEPGIMGNRGVSVYIAIAGTFDYWPGQLRPAGGMMTTFHGVTLNRPEGS